MPTFEATLRFWRDYRNLDADQRHAFMVAVRKFIVDLDQKRIRPGLRVKGVQGAPGVFEMSWAPDGRATFGFGSPIRGNEPHIIWRRIGTHDVLGDA